MSASAFTIVGYFPIEVLVVARAEMNKAACLQSDGAKAVPLDFILIPARIICYAICAEEEHWLDEPGSDLGR